MSLNWMRHFELQLMGDNGDTLYLSEFKATYTINWFAISSATRTGVFKIYNLSPQTVRKIAGREFTKIRLIAGYYGVAPTVDASQVGIPYPVDPASISQSGGRNYGQLFSGEIRYTLTGKDNPVDAYVLIQAADSEKAFLESQSNHTLAAGWTAQTLFNALMNDFAHYGVTAGRTPPFPATAHSRGRVIHGMTRDIMDDVARMCDATWMLVDNQVQMIRKDDYVHEPIELNSKTGLVGMPQQTIDKGVNVRCLINPNIRVNGLIHLDERSIYQNDLASQSQKSAGAQNSNPGGKSQSSPPVIPGVLATDGIYKVTGIVYTGDTRGQAWYMDMVCMPRGASNQ